MKNIFHFAKTQKSLDILYPLIRVSNQQLKHYPLFLVGYWKSKDDWKNKTYYHSSSSTSGMSTVTGVLSSIYARASFTACCGDFPVILVVPVLETAAVTNLIYWRIFSGSRIEIIASLSPHISVKTSLFASSPTANATLIAFLNQLFLFWYCF